MKTKVGETFRLARLILRFYRRFCFVSLAISLFIVMKSAALGAPATIFAFWIKIMTTAVIGGFIYYSYHPEFQYYKNLGIGRNTMLIAAVSLDLLLYILMSATVSRLYD
ncbi:MAG: hypothetical protein ABS46_07880 [Cytophagaceae bacterium SCN 52-12]|nr:MAG: hypothetical protein ABS46_07880 [Cytophagaceae bacterium SCN 52-12]